MGSISHHITPLVIDSLGGGQTHTQTHTHTHTHTHTSQNYKPQVRDGAQAARPISSIQNVRVRSAWGITLFTMIHDPINGKPGIIVLYQARDNAYA